MTNLSIAFSVHSSKTSWTTKTVEFFKQQVEVANTRVKVELIAGKQRQEVSKLQDGTVGMAAVSLSDLGKPFSVLHRPYLFRNLADVKQFYASESGQAFRQMVLEKTKVRILGLIYLGVRHLGTSGLAVNSPLDLKGCTLRMPEGASWEHLGKSLGGDKIVSISIHDLTTALQEKRITGVDSPMPALVSYNLNGITKVNMTAHLVDSLFITISEEVWQKLTPSEQDLLSKSAQIAEEFNETNRLEEENSLIDQYTHEGKVIYPDLKSFQEQVQSYYENVELSDDEKTLIAFDFPGKLA